MQLWGHHGQLGRVAFSLSGTAPSWGAMYVVQEPKQALCLLPCIQGLLSQAVHLCEQAAGGHPTDGCQTAANKV